MRPPAFWAERQGTWQSALLAPLGAAYAAVVARRLAQPGYRAPVPVICCGNATLGGAGKTVVALDLLARLTALGHRPHVLLRGYGGRVRGPHRVAEGEPWDLVGDEALLLAQAAPTWAGADRAASARAAVAAGADLLVMDDGLQNPGLEKTAALLVVDGGAGFGNGRVFPAGPLREPVAAAAGRCAAAVLIGEDRSGAAALLPPGLPVLRARMVPGPETAALRGTEVAAFAGIGRPDKFFAMLREAGAQVKEALAFPDHHPFGAPDLRRLEALAQRRLLVTTAKDAVRLPTGFRAGVTVATVTLAWERDPVEFLGLNESISSRS
jgi:tetraacyldisaccharide 4'-kinase